MLDSQNITSQEIELVLNESVAHLACDDQGIEEEITIAFQESLKEMKALQEGSPGKISSFGHTVLDILGVVGIFLPPLDIVADAFNACWYAYEGRFVLAGLSAVSMVPVAGDVLGKGGKVSIIIAKNLKKVPAAGPFLAKTFTKLGDKALTEAASAIQKLLKAHKTQITGKVVKLIEKHKMFKWVVRKIGSEEMVVKALDRAITKFYGINKDQIPEVMRKELEGEGLTSAPDEDEEVHDDDPDALSPEEEDSVEKSQGPVQSSASIMGGSIVGMKSSAKQKEIIRDLKILAKDAKRAKKIARAKLQKKVELAQDELGLDPDTVSQLRDEPEEERMAIINAEEDPERRKVLRKVLFQEGKLVKTVIDFEELRSKKVDEMFLSQMGGWLKLALNWMFGGATAPIAFRGTERELKSLSNALGGEKNFIETAKRFGLDHPTTYKSKSKLDVAIKGFEKETGLKWPFK